MKKNLLLVMAHPDDAELWAGGTIAVHRVDYNIYILLGSDSEIRSREAKEGAKILGAELILERELTEQNCAMHIEEIGPEIIITHREDDIHPEHRYVNNIVMKVIPGIVIKKQIPRKLYTCDTYNSLTLHGKVDGKVIIDVSSVFDLKLKALTAHESQPLEHFTKMAIVLGSLWGARGGVEKAEAFDPVPILGMLPSMTRL